jgi:hypothetical protein
MYVDDFLVLMMLAIILYLFCIPDRSEGMNFAVVPVWKATVFCFVFHVLFTSKRTSMRLGKSSKKLML